MIHEYACRLDRVKDGDTFVLWIDLGFGCWTLQPIRVLNYNAPELPTSAGVEARDTAIEILEAAKLITVRTYKDARTFERWLAEVWVDGIAWGNAMENKGIKSVGKTPLDLIRKRGAIIEDAHIQEPTDAASDH